MMTDRELLIFAAIAVGATFDEQLNTYIFHTLDETYIGWNPLESNESAFILATFLKMDMIWDEDEARVYEYDYDGQSYYGEHTICAIEVVHDNQDRNSAMRRAITRCAAEIGEKRNFQHASDICEEMSQYIAKFMEKLKDKLK